MAKKKGIPVELGKNQFVETEATYVVALSIFSVNANPTATEFLGQLVMKTVRATSADMALGMCIRLLRTEEKYHDCAISSFGVKEV